MLFILKYIKIIYFFIFKKLFLRLAYKKKLIFFKTRVNPHFQTYTKNLNNSKIIIFFHVRFGCGLGMIVHGENS